MNPLQPDNPFDPTSWKHLENEIHNLSDTNSRNAKWITLLFEGKNAREIGKTQAKYTFQLTIATYVLALATIGLIIATLRH